MVTTQEILKKYGISQTDVKKLGEPQSPKLFGKEVEFKGATVGGARFDIKTPEDDLLKKYEVRTEKARAVKAEREAGGERLAGAQLDDLVGLANTINKLEDLLAEMKQKNILLEFWQEKCLISNIYMVRSMKFGEREEKKYFNNIEKQLPAHKLR